MIKVGYLISYDYNYIFNSLKTTYNDSDRIYIAFDKDYLTWNGNKFFIPYEFFDQIKSLDIENKIEFYLDSFYVQGMTTMEAETRERNMLAKKMGKGWHIQLDTDEYIYDFKIIKKLFKKLWFINLFPFLNITFTSELITLYKKIDNGYLYIENGERVHFLFNKPVFYKARTIQKSIRIFTGIKIIHQSWAREEVEILDKIKNWGHNNDFNTIEYFNKWKSLNSKNYLSYLNFHPIVPVVWKELKIIEKDTVEGFIDEYEFMNKQKLKISTLGIMKIIFIYYYKKIKQKIS